MTQGIFGTSLWEAVLQVITNPNQVPQESLTDRLIRAFQAHTSAEKDSLAAYRDLAETLDDPVSQLVLREVLVDEEHHHALFDRLSAQLAYEIAPRGDVAPLPFRALTDDADPVALRTLADLARDEREGARRMRELARASRHEYGGLMSLLLEGMAMDSEKHARMLRFVMRRQRARA